MQKLILTEQSNPKTRDIDLKDSLDIVKLINEEDKTVAVAVEKVLPEIARTVDLIAEKIKAGGNLLYFGAGTSGRLGVLDASECPPTFGVEKYLVRGYIAGGDKALREAIEGAEDNLEDGINDLVTSAANSDDVVICLSASGGAAYICGVLSKARELKIFTVALTCNKQAKCAQFADIHIAPEVGPEVITGSTRLKAGTAQKMVLNMLTTASMIKIGKTYHNYMIDVMPTNKKLIERATRIIMDLTGVDYEIANRYLFDADKSVKVATIMIKKNVDKETAYRLLAQKEGKLRLIIGE